MAETSGTDQRSGLGALVRYWGPPIVIGLAAGLAIWALWQFLFVSEVERLVAGWRWAETDEEMERNDALAEKIRALGPAAGRDLVRAFDDASCEFTDHKIWIGELLLDEPFEDAAAMADLARNGDACDRRVASTLLALALGREVDPDLVLPGILDWLEDIDADYHDYPINAVRAMRPLYGDWDARAKTALLALAAKRPARDDLPPELDWTEKDREDACAALAEWMPDADVLALFLELLGDDTDMTGPRVHAVRALSANGIFTQKELWIAALASSDHVIRQATAENLFRIDNYSKDDDAFDAGLAALHVDESEYVRVASVDTQTQRRRPTMLPVIDQLLEDWDEWVRHEALKAVSVFRAEPGAEARNGMLLHLLATSSSDPDLNGTILALFAVTGKLPEGIGEQHVDRRMWQIDEAVLEAFKKDREGRQQAVAFYAEEFAGRAKWTVDERKKTLEKLLEHADERNRKRATDELGKLR